MLGPGQVEDPAVGVGPQPGEAVGAGQGALDPHVGDLADRAGGQAVTAGLLAGEDLLLHQGHVPAGLGQPVGARRARRTAPDHEDVVDVARFRSLPVDRTRADPPTSLGWRRGRRGSRPPMVGAVGRSRPPAGHTRPDPRPRPDRRPPVDVLAARAAW